VPALLLGAAACAPFFDRPKQVEIRPVQTQGADGAAADENTYRSAAKAIDDRDYALALEYLQAARERQPHDVRVLNAFGVVYDKLGRFDLSARYYAQARAVEPHSTIVLANIAYSRALQGLTKREPAKDALADAAPLTRAKPAAPASFPVQQSSPGVQAVLAATSAAPVAAPGADSVRAPALIATLPRNESTALHSAPASSTGLAPVRAAANMPLLTGHPLIIVNASGRKGATGAMRHRLVHLGWTAPRWAARDGADTEQTILFYARPHSAAARALVHTLRFRVHLAGRSCDCGGLELVVGKDFLRSGTLAANLESGQDDPGGASQSAIPTPSKEHHHVPAKA
jgi:tetratricopeptide (TPR) repeat protein